MDVAVNLKFADNDDAAVRAWWALCDRAGMSSIGSHSSQSPHVTLTVMQSDDVDGLLDRLERRLDAEPARTLMLTHLGLFIRPGTVLYLGVSMTEELLGLHERVVQLAHDVGAHVWELYRPGIWIPHVTLARGFELGTLRDALPDDADGLPDLPVKINVDRITVEDIGDGRVIGNFSLS